jgi:hypothetical protein
MRWMVELSMVVETLFLIDGRAICPHEGRSFAKNIVKPARRMTDIRRCDSIVIAVRSC